MSLLRRLSYRNNAVYDTTLGNHTIFANTLGVLGTAQAQFILASDGKALGQGGVSSGNVKIDGITGITRLFNTTNGYAINEWHNNSPLAGLGTNFDVYASWVPNDGFTAALTGSALNTWLNLGSERSWILQEGGNDGGGVLTVTIAPSTNHSIIAAQGLITLNAYSSG